MTDPSSRLRISVAVTSLFLLMLIASLVFLVTLMSSYEIVHIKSDSMKNGSRGSIEDGDLVKMVDVGSFQGVTTYVEGREKGYSKAGSYGDVLFFKPNGDEDATLIVHRAVVSVYFNSSTYHPLTGEGGGFDIPSLNILNVNGTISIKDYEWPRIPDPYTLVIDLGEVLDNFARIGKRPHSGFITKGDNNRLVDQTGVFTDTGDLFEPVTVDWIRGRMEGKLDLLPVLLSTGVSSVLLLVMIRITVFQIKRTRGDP